MEKVILFGIAVLGYFFMRTLTGLKILPLLRDIIAALTGRTIKSVDKFRESTLQEFARMSLDAKKKSKKYRFYCFVNEILAAFNLRERGINVEGAVIAVFLIILCTSIAVGFLTTKVFYFVVSLVALIPLTIAGVFLLSRVRVRKRKQDLLDAMDILCSVMSDGFLQAVKNSLAQLPESTRPYFNKFLKNVELLNISIPNAIGLLNSEIGSLYDEFCASVINYEVNRAGGMETLFSFYISENALTLERDRKTKQMSDAANTDFFASIGAIAVFGFFASGTLAGDSSTGSIWETPFGKVVIFALLGSAFGIFIYIQYLLSKAYNYTEKDD